jgi:hypothetical protein
MFRASDASSIFAASAAFSAIGVSHITGLPAASAARTVTV